jgi:hydrogenase maturation protein HypF
LKDGHQSLRILVTGRVQGVGFRPFVSRLAGEFKLTGWVQNRGGEVEIRAEGEADALAGFVVGLTGRAPPLARPDPPQVSEVSGEGFQAFEIRRSRAGEGADVHVPPDYFVCADCLAEMQDPGERRYRYPVSNCTQCGPRYTLIAHLPYDRPNTAMAAFPLCPACRAEYENPQDRRYHAQPLACAECGPRLLYREAGQADVGGSQAALAACVSALRAGLIVAVKGVGGYHLVCDAGDEAAVARLRRRKHRPAKPLAVLLPDLEWVSAVAEPEACEREWLESPLRPIVLMKKREGAALAGSVAPGLGEVGVMLPYSPLHHLLAEAFGGPLVATSANVSGEPVLTEAGEVERRLGAVADAFLHHDRPILRPADDSVFRRVAGAMRPLRLGRGLAPVERELPFELERPLLAVGADLKNTVALAFGRRVVVSPHIGDLGSPRSAEVFERVAADLQALYGVAAQGLVCDAHPDYRSSRWAKARGLPLARVFHHRAHASALLGEHGLPGEALVFAWDGVGYGEDGALWGGEALLGRPGAWRRAGSLRPFRLPGGDQASREPWRCALALCWEAGLDWPGCPRDSTLLRHAYQRGINCPPSSSAGRLFDAAAALLGLAGSASFEGESAMRLEAASRAVDEAIDLPLAWDSGLWRIDWVPLLPMLMGGGLEAARRASLFHASLAGGIAKLAATLREERGVVRVGLCGGVFQNRLLAEQAARRLAEAGFEVLLPREIPANDAGISFGQIVEAGAAQGL